MQYESDVKYQAPRASAGVLVELNDAECSWVKNH